VEVVEVLHDPEVVSYGELLDLFWKSHDPGGRPYTNQYSSLILATDDQQLTEARLSARRQEQEAGRKVATRIETLDRFYPAEDYHQKYYLRQDRTFAREFNALFGGDQDAFRDSAAAARVNAYVSGDGTSAQLAGEIGLFGLSENAREYLVSKVGDGSVAGGCAVESP